MLYILISLFVIGVVIIFLSSQSSAGKESGKNVHKYQRIIVLCCVLTLAALLSFVMRQKIDITWNGSSTTDSTYMSVEPLLQIEGERTVLVVSRRGDSTTLDIHLKEQNSKTLRDYLPSVHIPVNIATEEGAISVYQHKTGESYIEVTSMLKGPLVISDNHNSSFQYIEKRVEEVEDSIYTYYAFIGELDKEYTITVNGTTYQLIAD